MLNVGHKRLILIRGIKPNELKYFFLSCRDESWTNDISHINCLYISYANDFFIAYESDTIVGFVLAIKESKNFGTISNLLVLQKYSCRGIGKKLLSHAIKHLDTCQIALDCIPGKEKIYENFGFKSYYQTSTFLYERQTNYQTNYYITVSDVSLESILEYKQKMNFLKKTILLLLFI